MTVPTMFAGAPVASVLHLQDGNPVGYDFRADTVKVENKDHDSGFVLMNRAEWEAMPEADRPKIKRETKASKTATVENEAAPPQAPGPEAKPAVGDYKPSPLLPEGTK